MSNLAIKYSTTTLNSSFFNRDVTRAINVLCFIYAKKMAKLRETDHICFIPEVIVDQLQQLPVLTLKFAAKDMTTKVQPLLLIDIKKWHRLWTIKNNVLT